MKKLFSLILVCITFFSYAQTTSDLFGASDTQVSWLGIDFSNVKLVGDFSQFHGAGEKNPSQIRNTYFPAWNRLILDEREKYDIAGALRKDKVTYDIDMIMELNSKTPLEEMESYNAPTYSKEDIEKFIGKYDLKGKQGIGVVLIAETLNKSNVEAYFHFVAINLSNGNILIHDRIRSEPSGIGLRNYWAGAIYDVIKDINKSRYKAWKAEYAKR